MTSARSSHSCNLPRWHRRIHLFDGLEVSPCRVVGFANETPFVETCEPDEAQFWTVCGHRRSGGVEAFRDFATYRSARRMAERLLRCHDNLAHHGIYEPNGSGTAARKSSKNAVSPSRSLS